VVIPSYNSAGYVTTAVASVLGQTFEDLEVLVVDDGSTDDTRDRLAGYRSDSRFRYLHQANAGVACARNLGIAQSRGEYVAFLDADDVWKPEKVARQLAALAGDVGVGVCFTAFQVVDADLRPLRVVGGSEGVPTLEALLFRGNIVGTPSTVMVARSLLDQVGGFDPALSQCADWDLWVRLALRTPFVALAEPLAVYRTHGKSMSRDVALLERDSTYLLRKAFAIPCLAERWGVRSRTALARNYIVLAGSYFQAGLVRDCARCLLKAARLDVRQCGYAAAFPLRAAGRLLAAH
jgi:glycosyltransferase involved in cell wall biosynthesis